MEKILKINEFFFVNGEVDDIASYISSNTGIDLNPYNEVWRVYKRSGIVNGDLYISFKSNKAIRINWIKNRKNIDSIDLWEDFSFERNPDWTIDLKDFYSPKDNLDPFVSFFKDPKNFKYATESELVYNEELKNDDEIKSEKSPKQSADTGSIRKTKDIDFELDIFKTIEYYANQVARGKSNSLIISGMSGIGKTQVVKDVVGAIGMVSDVHYYFAKGVASAAGLYEILFKNRDKLIIFDDCDDVFDEADNMLKAALDTYPVREISKLASTKVGGSYFDSTGMGDHEIEEKYDNTGKLPNKFEFTGQIIFISNLNEDEFDPALISRSLHVDVQLTKEEVVDRMKQNLVKICSNSTIEDKKETLNYLIEITDKYPTKFPLNMRTLIHCINIKSSNPGKVRMGDRDEFLWKALVRKYLMKPTR